MKGVIFLLHDQNVLMKKCLQHEFQSWTKSIFNTERFIRQQFVNLLFYGNYIVYAKQIWNYFCEWW